MRTFSSSLFRLALLQAFVLIFTSCDDYLDELPDNRTELSSIEKAQKLLTSAYLCNDPLLVAEFSSDNVDNYGTNNPNTNRFVDQVYNWMDVTESDNSAPEMFWEDCYVRIATANLALEALDNLSDDEQKGRENDVRAARGEALLCRAYAHFMLANLFCQAYNSQTSDSDLGIVYMTRPAQKLDDNPARLPLSEVYEQIDKDISEAIPLIGSNYSVPKYHFNEKAAHAFACRFYLYYEKWDKAIEHATRCLGAAPEAMLRDWSSMALMAQDFDAITQHYIDASLNCNLLLLTSYSYMGIVFGPYRYLSKYSHGKYLAQQEDGEAQNIWGSAPLYQEMSTYSATNLDKTIFWKLPYLFEYHDAVAGTGYYRTVYPAFTADEALLNRAEAYVITRQFDKAADDLTRWMRNFVQTSMTLTPEYIQRFYALANYSYSDEKGVQSTIKKHLHPAFQIDEEGSLQECMLQCVLGFRRIETLQTGLRWYDVKRYGIEIPRRVMNAKGEPEEKTDMLTRNDPRRAIQIPLRARAAGVMPNPR